MTHRLFAAIRPPRSIRAILLAAMGGIEGARWQDEDQLHLTLRFLGEIDGARAEDTALALSRMDFAPFDLSLRGVGSFDKRGRIHTLYAGIAPSEALVRLQGKVERACQMAGLAPEPRSYAPHITLARINASSGPVGGFLAQHGDLASQPWHIDRFALYESHLGSAGARYEAVMEVPARR